MARQSQASNEGNGVRFALKRERGLKEANAVFCCGIYLQVAQEEFLSISPGNSLSPRRP
jgi:hypothetical protein